MTAQPYTDHYVFQMSDGAWWIAPKTSHHRNGTPRLPREYDRSYGTKEEAETALRAARAGYLAASRPAPAATEPTQAGLQYVMPGCEKDRTRTSARQFDLF